MVWSVALIVFGILFMFTVDYCMDHAMSKDPHAPFYGLYTFALLFFCYCATSLLLCKLLLHWWLARHWYWVPVCVLVGVISA